SATRASDPSSALRAAAKAVWGLTEEIPSDTVAAALKALDGSLARVADRAGSLPQWIRSLANAVAAGDPAGICLFCQEPGLAACLANKVTGVRAASVGAAA